MTQLYAGPEHEARSRNDNRAPKTVTIVETAPPEEPAQPTLRERTNQASKKGIFWLLLAAIVLMIVVGFTLGGWMTVGLL